MNESLIAGLEYAIEWWNATYPIVDYACLSDQI